MISSADAQARLARRLRALREFGLAGVRLTQNDVGKAMGTSTPLISSWESTTNPTVPPVSRLEAYATFFATERSVAKSPYRILPSSELTAQERGRRDELLRELHELREEALAYAADTDSLWHFPAHNDVTIVCAEVPEELHQAIPYTDPESPDYVKAYRFTDLDALIDLHGHIRAANPTTRVNITTLAESRSDLFTAHLVLLGRVELNTLARELRRFVDIPVRQLPRGESSSDAGGFEVSTDQESRRFEPVLREHDGRAALVEDVGHFFRGPNPFNNMRSLTICNGAFGRGTLGAVRASTDPRFRGRNEDYVRKRFSDREQFSVLFRVLIVNGEVVTPDWTQDTYRLHEWPP